MLIIGAPSGTGKAIAARLGCGRSKRCRRTQEAETRRIRSPTWQRQGERGAIQHFGNRQDPKLCRRGEHTSFTDSVHLPNVNIASSEHTRPRPRPRLRPADSGSMRGSESFKPKLCRNVCHRDEIENHPSQDVQSIASARRQCTTSSSSCGSS